MAITATERWSGPKLVKAGGSWTAERKFDVIYTGTDAPGSPGAAHAKIYTQFSIQMNVAFGTTSGTQFMYCQSVNCDTRGLGVYELTVVYATTPAGRFPVAGDPLSEPIEYVWEPGSVSERIDRDAYGNPISNANNDVFETTPSRYFGVIYLTIRKNLASYDVTAAGAFHNTVNSDTWDFGPVVGGTALWYLDPGQALCKAIRPMTEITSASPYVRVEYQFELRPPLAAAIDSDGLWDSFKYRVVNAGQRCFYVNGDPDSPGIGQTSMGHIIYKGGSELIQVSSDVLLDSDGMPLDTDSFAVNGIGSQTPVANPNPLSGLTDPPVLEVDSVSGIVYVKYQMYKTNTFNTLGL